jgi:uncharacterized membrane protein
MSMLISIAYPDAHQAPGVLPAVIRLRDQHVVDILDAIAVVIGENGVPRIHAATDGAGPTPDHSFWSGLMHALFSAPISDGANDAHVHSSANLARLGIAPEFVASFRITVHPGGSIVLVRVPHVIPAWAIPVTSRYGGIVTATPLRFSPETTPHHQQES